MKRGDLVHLPSHTFLYDTYCLHSDYKKLAKPGVGIVLEDQQEYLKLSFESNIWFVAKRDAYPINNGGKNDS